VYRFDRASHTFTDMKLYRPVFYPNGITLSGDGNVLFVAGMLGVIRVDLLNNESEDVDPGAHDTLSGIDGLYGNKGERLGVQSTMTEFTHMTERREPAYPSLRMV